MKKLPSGKLSSWPVPGVFAVLWIPVALCDPSAIQGFIEITEQSILTGDTARHADDVWIIPSSRKEGWSLLLQC